MKQVLHNVSMTPCHHFQVKKNKFGNLIYTVRGDKEYVSYTSRHLHQRIDEHRYSAIGNHLKKDHGLETIGDLTNNFSVLKKCNGKLDCLIYEMLFIKKKRPCLNTQSDSIRAKLLISICHYLHAHFYALSPRTVYIKLPNLFFFT